MHFIGSQFAQMKPKQFHKPSGRPFFTAIFIAMFAAAITYGITLTSFVGAVGQFQVSGTVRDSQNDPLQNVTVTANSPGTTNVIYGPVTTNSSGEYSLGVDFGTYDFLFVPVTESGLTEVKQSNVTVTANQEISVQFAPFTPTYTFSGHLKDDKGNGLYNNILRIENIIGNFGARTDVAGFFSIPVKAAADTQLLVQDESSSVRYDIFSAGPDISAGDVSQDLEVKTVSLKIVVRDLEGNVLPSASISGTTNGSHPNTTFSLIPGSTHETKVSAQLRATTQSDGVATMTSPDGITFEQLGIVLSDGQVFHPVSIITVNGDTEMEIVVPAIPTYTFSGHLKDDKGSGLYNNIIRVESALGNSGNRTEETGYFSLPVKADSQTQLIVIQEADSVRYTMTSDGPNMSLGDVAQDLQIKMSSLIIKVKDTNGNLLPNAVIRAGTRGSTVNTKFSLLPGLPTKISAQIRANTDIDGVATLISPDGIVFDESMGVTLSDGQVFHPTTIITVDGDTTVEITVPAIPTYMFSGYLLDDKGNGLYNNIVRVENTVGNFGNRTEETGHFNIPIRASASTQLLVQDESNSVRYNVSSVGPDMSSGDVTQDLEIKTVSLTIEVKDTNGNPVSDASISGQTNGALPNTKFSLIPGSSSETKVSAQLRARTQSDGIAAMTSPDGIVFEQLGIVLSDGQVFNPTSVITVDGDTTLVIVTPAVRPPAPFGLSVNSPSSLPVNLSWGAVSGVNYYNIYRDSILIGTSAATTTYADSTATDGMHSYHVTAVGVSGESTPSNMVSVTVDANSPTIGALTWQNNPKEQAASATLTVGVSDTLSGVSNVEYFLGDVDPGQGNGAIMNYDGSTAAVTFGTNFVPGVYKVSVRAKDNVGNWSAASVDYLVVYSVTGLRMDGKIKKDLVPSIANGDVLPGLQSGSTYEAEYDLDVRYLSTGQIKPNSDFQFVYNTGSKCNKPAQAVNCHTFELDASSIAWLIVSGVNNNTGTFAGTGVLTIDGVATNVSFKVTGVDGKRLTGNNNANDTFKLEIFTDGANVNVATPLYIVNTTTVSKQGVTLQ